MKKEPANIFARAFASLNKGLSFSVGGGKERGMFLENVSMLVASGMDMSAVLRAVKGEARSAHMKQVVAQLEHDVDGGSSLWRAFEKTNLFPGHALALIKIGEESGRLTENLLVIASTQAKERAFRSKIQSAMIYPVFVLSLALTVGIGIAWFILPNLSNVFSQLNLELPLITKILIAFGAFLSSYGVIAVPLFLGALFTVVYIVFIFPKTKVIGQVILFSTPGIRKLLQEVELARMGYTMGSLLKAGLPIVEVLKALETSSGIYMYKKFWGAFRKDIERGFSFQKAFLRHPEASHYIYPSIQQMIVAAEYSGRLVEAFAKIAQIFDAKTEDSTKNLSVILEPILLIFVWLGVLGVALAIILPIYSLIGGLNNNTF